MGNSQGDLHRGNYHRPQGSQGDLRENYYLSHYQRPQGVFREKYGRPLFIIVAGPTGSGKASLPQKVLDYLGRAWMPIPAANHFLIDNYVELDAQYGEAVKRIINKSCSDDLKGLCPEFKNQLLKPTPELFKKFSDAYFEAKKKGCQTGCSKKLDQDLAAAIKEGQDVVFETTGSYYPGWIFDVYKDNLQKFHYEIILAYSLADLCTLIGRNKTRAVTATEAWLRKETAHAPRLPDVSSDHYKKTVGQIMQVLNDILAHCAAGFDRSYCKSQIRVLVFDNSTRDILPPLDSARLPVYLDDWVRKINHIVNLNSPCGSRT